MRAKLSTRRNVSGKKRFDSNDRVSSNGVNGINETSVFLLDRYFFLSASSRRCIIFCCVRWWGITWAIWKSISCMHRGDWKGFLFLEFDMVSAWVDIRLLFGRGWKSRGTISLVEVRLFGLIEQMICSLWIYWLFLLLSTFAGFLQ